MHITQYIVVNREHTSMFIVSFYFVVNIRFLCRAKYLFAIKENNYANETQ